MSLAAMLLLAWFRDAIGAPCGESFPVHRLPQHVIDIRGADSHSLSRHL